MIHRSTDRLPEIALNHDSGTKKVLYNYQDCDTPCRQISRARFRTGDVCEKHVHPSLDEHFYWLTGHGFFVVDGQRIDFQAGDYLCVAAGESHEIHLMSDAECVCIGIALDWNGQPIRHVEQQHANRPGIEQQTQQNQ